jgi:hypothetical protein
MPQEAFRAALRKPLALCERQFTIQAYLRRSKSALLYQLHGIRDRQW